MTQNLPAPYASEATNKIYNLLFCDAPELYHGDSQGGGYPWDVLLSDTASEAELRRVLDDDALESRQRLLAAYRLRGLGFNGLGKELFGVIAEVSLEEGLDTVAAFADGTARYINHSEKMVIWESPTQESNAIISDLLSAGWNIVQRIGPWEDGRLPAPIVGNARISFLVSDGLYFGEAPFEVLQQDPMGGSVLSAAAALMGFLIDKSLGKSG